MSRGSRAAEAIATVGNVATHLDNIAEPSTTDSVLGYAATALTHVPEPHAHALGQVVGAALKAKRAVDVMSALDPMTRASAGRLMASSPPGYGTSSTPAPAPLDVSSAIRRSSTKVARAKIDSTMESARKSASTASALPAAAASAASSALSSLSAPAPAPAFVAHPAPSTPSTPLLRAKHGRGGYGTFS